MLRPHRILPSLSAAVFAASLTATAQQPAARPAAKPAPATPAPSAESRACVTCHEQKTPGIVAQWRQSKHAIPGVSCFECHNAEPKDPGAEIIERSCGKSGRPK